MIVAENTVQQTDEGKPPALSLALRVATDGDDILTATGGELRWFALDGDFVPVGAVFAPFALVQAFVSGLLAGSPDKVVIETLSGASMELARLAFALGFDVAVRLPAAARFVTADAAALRWLGGLLSSVGTLLPPEIAEDESLLRDRLPSLPPCAVGQAPLRGVLPREASRFGYEAYAFGRRDHALLYAMQEGFVEHFRGCGQVLDVGCGTGVFLEVLARHGLAAAGVERNEVSARYARSLGHTVFGEDALDYLATQRGAWDGIYCSHFIEHLPVDAAERLISETAAALRPGGVAVFVFPDPESIRSQLLGFWRDPEHVRFYHPELVATMAEVHGLEVEYDNQATPGRRIVPFSLEPPLPEATEGELDRGGWWSRSLRRMGIAPMAELQRARARSDALELAVRRLWEVNQTWAWDDNAVLRFRKRGGI